MHGAVQHPASDEDPGQCDGAGAGIKLQQNEAGHMEEQRPLKRVGEIGTDARLHRSPRVGAICATSDSPHRRRPGKGQQQIQQGVSLGCRPHE